MPVTDFVGQEIKPGDFVAKDGGGNSGKGYAMILYRVEAVSEADDAFKARCFDVRYPNGTAKVKLGRISKTTRPKKCVKVTPSDWAREMFDKADEGTLTPQDARDIASWIHKGKEP